MGWAWTWAEALKVTVRRLTAGASQEDVATKAVQKAGPAEKQLFRKWGEEILPTGTQRWKEIWASGGEKVSQESFMISGLLFISLAFPHRRHPKVKKLTSKRTTA